MDIHVLSNIRTALAPKQAEPTARGMAHPPQGTDQMERLKATCLLCSESLLQTCNSMKEII